MTVSSYSNELILQAISRRLSEEYSFMCTKPTTITEKTLEWGDNRCDVIYEKARFLLGTYSFI